MKKYLCISFAILFIAFDSVGQNLFNMRRIYNANSIRIGDVWVKEGDDFYGLEPHWEENDKIVFEAISIGDGQYQGRIIVLSKRIWDEFVNTTNNRTYTSFFYYHNNVGKGGIGEYDYFILCSSYSQFVLPISPNEDGKYYLALSDKINSEEDIYLPINNEGELVVSYDMFRKKNVLIKGLWLYSCPSDDLRHDDKTYVGKFTLDIIGE